MRTKWAIRRDQAGVSPVIATILMVAITVVLAAVLYVMVSGLVSGPGSTPRAMGIAVSKSSDGTNWQLTISSVDAGLARENAFLTVFRLDGTVVLQKTAFSALSGAQNASFEQVDTSATSIQPGDKVLLTVDFYVAGSSYQIADADQVLATGTLQ
ncbi:MAG: type IV pilin N-terminal domain-containing protein [Thermoplasmata archaeon]